MLLVPVQFPLTEDSTRTISQAMELATQLDDPHLYILHVNLTYRGKPVKRNELQRSVEAAVGNLPHASYHVRTTHLLEEAILNEAKQQGADYVIIGHSQRARWRRALASRLNMAVDLESFLPQHLDVEVVIAN
jgi:K+-sensing histidine kinase KdpD